MNIAEQMCASLMKAKNVAISIETDGDDPHVNKITSMNFYSRDIGGYSIDAKSCNNFKEFAPLFESETIYKTTYNAKHVYKMILGTSGCELENVICILLGEITLTVGLPREGLELEWLIKKYIAESEPWDSPAVVIYKIAELMQNVAKCNNLLRAWKIENGAVQSFGDMEYYGQKIDVDLWRRNIDSNIRIATEAREEMDKTFSPVPYEVDYDSNQSVLNALKYMDVKIDGEYIKNTSKATQKKLDGMPVMKHIAAYRSAMRGISTYGDSYLKNIHTKTGRVHFKYHQYGTETARPACYGGPNALNIPRDDKYRECFTTDEDRLLGTVDLSQIELRIMSDQSGDPITVKGFNAGVDFHCFTAEMLLNKGKVEKTDPIRTVVKEVSFGLPYGLSLGALYEKLKGMKLPYTFEQTKDLYYKYMRTFKRTIEWLEEQRSIAVRDFRIVNLNGRERNFAKPDMSLGEKELKSALAAIAREGANFPMQSLVSDIMKVSLARLRKAYKHLGYGANTPKGCRAYNMPYDELIYDFHKDFATPGFIMQKKIMQQAAQEMLRRVPAEVDGKLAHRWSK